MYRVCKKVLTIINKTQKNYSTSKHFTKEFGRPHLNNYPIVRADKPPLSKTADVLYGRPLTHYLFLTF